MSYQIALSALQAINTELDNISQNIANTGTTGYKSSRTNFSAMYSSAAPNGVMASSTTQSLGTAGGLLSTGRNLDVAISGNGYFVVQDATGVTNYTRSGAFDIDKNGYLVDMSGRQVQGFSQQATGGALGPLGALQVPTSQIPAKESTEVNYVGNLASSWTTPATTTFNADDPTSYNSSTVSVVYDSLGKQQTITQYFVKTAQNTVEVHYKNGKQELSTPATKLVFTSAGQLDTENSVVQDVSLTEPTPDPANPAPSVLNGANPLTIKFNYAGTTQFDGETSTATNASDGYASGTMVNVSVGDDGAVNVQYSNGMVQSVGKIALATFPSDSGLVAVDGTSWQASVTSGTALVGTPGSGTLGTLASQQLEQSNVEVASELVDLMSAQRNYQANTKVINTESEIMQALMQVV